jgi:hypothetical protein
MRGGSGGDQHALRISSDDLLEIEKRKDSEYSIEDDS